LVEASSVFCAMAAAIFLLCAIGATLSERGGLSPREIRRFERDGAILIRGLLSPSEVTAAREAAIETHRSGKALGQHYSKLAFHRLQDMPALRHLALHSRVPAVAAQLMTDRGEGAGEVRLLKDAFLSHEPGKSGCGWHRDDLFFWPCPEDAPGPGINVWVALSEYSPRRGGGLAVALGSHTARWHDDAVKAISTAGPNGEPPNTCGLELRAPRLNRKVEARRKEWRMQPGDAIVHTRQCFHRGVPLTRAGTREYDGQPLLRYSVRYMPGHATLDARSPDPAVTKLKLGGRTLRELGWRYPRVWPTVEPKEEAQLARGTDSKPWK
jgi:hypothetical protein